MKQYLAKRMVVYDFLLKSFDIEIIHAYDGSYSRYDINKLILTSKFLTHTIGLDRHEVEMFNTWFFRRRFHIPAIGWVELLRFCEASKDLKLKYFKGFYQIWNKDKYKKEEWKKNYVENYDLDKIIDKVFIHILTLRFMGLDLKKIYELPN